MDLIVAFQSTSSSSSSLNPHSNCFVSLPSTIVASLSELTPFASLIIVRLHHKSQTNRQAVYVACSGGTTHAQDQIAFHPNYAAALHLKQGDVVTATVVERISNYPRRCVDVAYLRPISYDQCQANQSTSTSFQLAAQHFAALNVTAPVLETSVLSQMRLVYDNLIVPVQMPAKECLYVRVKSMDTSGDSSCPYAVLTPSSQLSIEPPPTDSSQTQVKKIFNFFRALPMRNTELAAISSSFQTHAILPADGSSGVRYAYVSRKDVQNNSIALPVAFICHQAIPKRHIWVPSHICHALSLTPLLPLLVEEVFAFPQGGNDFLAEPCQFSNHLVTFSELKSQQGVYYNSMILRGLKAHVDGERTLPTNNRHDAFVWDATGLKKPERGDEDEIFNDSENLILEGVFSSEERVAAVNKRQMVNGFRCFPGQTMCLLESNITRERKGRLHHPLLRDENLALHSLKDLTPSSKKVLHVLMQNARSVFRARRKGGCSPSAIVIQGAIGCGKTQLCSLVASLLQDLALTRTVWIRCKVHSNDALETSILRIRSAFRGAVDGGPGLIVLDDLGSWVQISQDTSGDNPKSRLKDNRGTQICVALERELKRKRAEPLLVLISCKGFMQLNKSIRVPGLMSLVRTVQLPNKSDRAFLFRLGLQHFIASDGGHNEHGVTHESLDNLAALSEGFSPRDINISLSRTRLQSNVQAVSEKNIGRTLRILENILKTMVPVNRIGIKFTKQNPSDELSWKKIGGLSRAKQQLWEALQLPSLYPDIFQDVPLRLPHGILLFGPPGCGKTMLAKTAAFESKMRCVVIRGPELLNKYVGESEAEVRRAFNKAAQAAPCVLLFDEFDALAPRRGGYGTGVSDRVVNTLLACMDGAERLAEGVYILATTSRPEIIDPALLRPGRLDKWIYLGIPAAPDERLDILRSLYINYFEEFDGADVILEQIAKTTNGYTGADLGSIINDAHLLMLKRRGTTDFVTDHEAICNALQKALSKSRPSLNQAQRYAYQRTMVRFTGRKDHEQNGGDHESNPYNLGKAFRSIVALK